MKIKLKKTKSKIRYVYKIVIHNCSDNDDVFVSGYTQYNALKYVVNKQTLPFIGKLFAFKTLRQAKEYHSHTIESPNPRKIFKATATGVEAIKRRIGFKDITPEDCKMFWEGLDPFHSTWESQSPPEGTMVCDSITLLKIVHESKA